MIDAISSLCQLDFHEEALFPPLYLILYLGMSSFSHLHTHSHYSLLGALPKIPELVSAAKKFGMKALALTDNGNLYGAIEFFQECKKNDIKPIIGVDAYVALRTRHDKQAGVDNTRFRLILLARDETGYKNLIKLTSLSHLEGFYYKPRIDKELLEKYSEGLTAISPSNSGEIAKALRNKDRKKATDIADRYKNIFGRKNFFIELTYHPEIPGHAELMKELLEFAKKENIKVVAAQDIFYINPEDKKAWQTLMSVQTNSDRGRHEFDEEEKDFSFRDREQMTEAFKNIPEALSSVDEIVGSCNLELKFGSWVFPDFKVESGLSPDKELRRLVCEGLDKRGLKKTKEVEERIEYELKIINDKGYAPYFLVVGDLLRYAHENGILTNIRGSVAGSMVTYLAGITNVNPIEYGLPFERFLNPERPSPPDIDMDFADNRRDEMIEYARQKYGADKVAQIGTFGTMMARGAVRDVARALGYPYSTGDRIARLMPFGSQGFPMTIDRAFEMIPELKDIYQKEDDVREVIDMARKIEGCARHISVHAAGVIISPTDITDYVPLQYDPKGERKIITQYDMYSVEDAGLLKFDFLGLKNLSILADTVDRIRAIEEKLIDPENIPLDDPKTFSILARGETEGLFQLNGEAMTKFLMELKPSTIHDINAMVALYRPGPMQFIPEFIKRKHNPSLIKYLDMALAPILERTYGVLVYQDDLLLIAKDIAGYTWGEVDKFRKAVGKKIPKEMVAQKEKFIDGCISHSNWPHKKAVELWTWIEPFAAYGFNKAHAASYGRVAYQTAYFKANYPAIYMSAVLTADSGDVEKVGEIISECKRMNIPVMPPSANESFRGFSVVRGAGSPDKIRFGLATIKNFGEGISQSIVRERKEGGKYTSLADFLERVGDRNLNKKSLESLIKAGALEEFGERGQMLQNLETLLTFHKESAQGVKAQDSLFGLMSENSQTSRLTLSKSKPATEKDKLVWEKELLGLYISGHPLNQYKSKLEERSVNIARIKKEFPEGLRATVAGIIEDAREVITKGNEKMMFVRIADLSDSMEVVVFPRVLNEFKEVIKPENCVVVVGSVSKRNNSISIIAEKIRIF